jgi:hypothetical protein
MPRQRSGLPEGALNNPYSVTGYRSAYGYGESESVLVGADSYGHSTADGPAAATDGERSS